MRTHTHTYDSRLGYILGHQTQALMCRCGNWGMSGGGSWQSVPWELLPASCRLGTRLHKAATILRNTTLALIIGILLALIICPEGFLR